MDALRLQKELSTKLKDIIFDELKKYKLNAFGIEEGCCLVIDNSSYYVIKENKANSVYLFDKNKDYQMIPLYEGIIYEENSDFRS